MQFNNVYTIFLFAFLAAGCGKKNSNSNSFASQNASVQNNSYAANNALQDIPMFDDFKIKQVYTVNNTLNYNFNIEITCPKSSYTLSATIASAIANNNIFRLKKNEDCSVKFNILNFANDKCIPPSNKIFTINRNDKGVITATNDGSNYYSCQSNGYTFVFSLDTIELDQISIRYMVMMS